MARRWSGPAAAIGLPVLVLALAAAPARAQEPVHWKHGIIDPKSDAGFVEMVAEPQFAGAQGLDIQLIPLQSDTLLLRALIAGDVDSYEGGPGGAILAAARGGDVKIIGCEWPGLPHGFFAKASIATPQDLKGKALGISAPGALPDLLARALLDKYGVPADDVRFVSMGSDGDRYKALAAGVVDAAVVSGEYVPIAASQGLKLLVAGRDVMPNYLRLCFHTAGKTIAERGDLVARFLAAEMQALRFATTHRDEEITLTRQLTRTEPNDPRPAYVFDDVVQAKAVDPDLAIPLQKLVWMQEQLVKTGNLSRPIDLAKVIDEGPRAKAAALARQ